MASMRKPRVPVLIAAVLALIAGLALAVILRMDGGAGQAPSGGGPGAPGQVSPFTGLAGKPGPVLAVKIDNVGPARPHTGLGTADLVYVEQVEAGQSRILAIFSSRLPPVLGPVRSAREADLELLRQFGEPAFAYSGAQSALLPIIRAAPQHSVLPGDAPSAFFRSSDRPAPHNLYLRPERALDAAPGATVAKDIGFRFGAAPADGRALNEYTVRFPAARFTFTWSADQERWLVSMDSRAATTTDGGRLGAATVVVQDVTVRPSRFQDRWGSVSPYTETTGSGTALVLRDGKAFEAHWSRPAPTDGTSFTTTDGERLNFTQGPVWVVYRAR
jgi:hypothetical protein